MIIHPTPPRKFLYSPGFGAGWSTWNPEYADFCLFYEPIITFLEGGGHFGESSGFSLQPASELHPVLEGFIDDLAAKYGEESRDAFYLGGADDLQVGHCPSDEQFRIDEYDGSETYVFRRATESEWH